MRALLAISLAALLAGCVTEIGSIGEDKVTLIEDFGFDNPRGRVLIKARQACALYGRVPVLVKIGVNSRMREFACAEPPAVEGDMSAYGELWWKKAQREAAEIEASAD